MSNVSLNSNTVTNPGEDTYMAIEHADGIPTARMATQTLPGLQDDVLQTSSNLSLNPNAYNLTAFGNAVASEVVQDEQLLQMPGISPTDSAKVMTDLMTLMSGASSQTAGMDPNFAAQVGQQVAKMGGTLPTPGFTYNPTSGAGGSTSSNVNEGTNTYTSDHKSHISTVTITGRTATIDNNGRCSVEQLPDGCNVSAKDLARRLALNWSFHDACTGSQSTGADANVNEATNTWQSNHNGHVATVTITGRTATIDNGGKCTVEKLPDGCNVNAKDLARRLALGWTFSDSCTGNQSSSSS